MPLFEVDMDKKRYEIRSTELSREDAKLVGYVVKWNSRSQLIWGDFYEQFAPKAFSESLKNQPDIRALFEHDHKSLLGRTTSNTLILNEDDRGLRFELTPPDTQLGRDLLVSVDRGDIRGMSFGFIATSESWDFNQEPCLRTVTNAEIYEVTVTSMPAYQESDIQIAKRSMIEAKAKLQPNLCTAWLDLVEL